MLFVIIAFCQLIYSTDILERGILESNSLDVKNYLNDRITKSNPLTSLELEQYLDLAQHQIVVRYNQLESNKIKPEKISPYLKAACVCSLLNILTVLGFIETPFSIKHRATIIKFFWGTFISTILLAIPATIEMKAYEREIKELYENSIHIKQLIYKAASTSQ